MASTGMVRVGILKELNRLFLENTTEKKYTTELACFNSKTLTLDSVVYKEFNTLLKQMEDVIL